VDEVKVDEVGFVFQTPPIIEMKKSTMLKMPMGFNQRKE